MRVHRWYNSFAPGKCGVCDALVLACSLIESWVALLSHWLKFTAVSGGSGTDGALSFIPKGNLSYGAQDDVLRRRQSTLMRCYSSKPGLQNRLRDGGNPVTWNSSTNSSSSSLAGLLVQLALCEWEALSPSGLKFKALGTLLNEAIVLLRLPMNAYIWGMQLEMTVRFPSSGKS